MIFLTTFLERKKCISYAIKYDRQKENKIDDEKIVGSLRLIAFPLENEVCFHLIDLS